MCVPSLTIAIPPQKKKKESNGNSMSPKNPDTHSHVVATMECQKKSRPATSVYFSDSSPDPYPAVLSEIAGRSGCSLPQIWCFIGLIHTQFDTHHMLWIIQVRWQRARPRECQPRINEAPAL